MERTQVAIIGGGPAGMLLSHLLHLSGIDSVVLERQTKAHVLKRIRAEVLEPGTVKLLREAGLGERMDLEGHAHDGSYIVWQDRRPFLINTVEHCGKPMWSYGQTAITRNLSGPRTRRRPCHRRGGERPPARSRPGRAEGRLRQGRTLLAVACDFIAGCDGFHGVSRQAFRRRCCRPSSAPILSAGSGSCRSAAGRPHLRPARARLRAGVAARDPMLSRYYIQCDLDDRIADWPTSNSGRS